ncbi:MAG TPA: tripartite tricarboxylate transporter substrate-binding protein [Burkholderiales bacterium]|nr:tripartite tricarboxylate transporter substrate-binding protein [Burkholderiales bacterium]
MKSVVRTGLAVAVTVVNPAMAQEQYPSKVVRLVAPAAGGNADIVARFVATGLTSGLGQQVIVDNRGAIAPGVVAKAPPDGYTILVTGSPAWLLPIIKPGVPWDAKDFAPITLATSSPSLLVAHPSVPVTSVRQLIALAKARPGELNFASGTVGATPQLAGEMFKQMAGINVTGIAYKGTGPAVTAVMTGEVHFMFPGAPAAMPYVKQGRLKALAVCSLEPSPFAPGVPTVAATGLPGFESISPFGIMAPRGTPAAIVERLNQEIARTLNNPDVKSKLFNAGSEVVANSPEAFAAKIRGDIERVSKLVKTMVVPKP